MTNMNLPLRNEKGWSSWFHSSRDFMLKFIGVFILSLLVMLSVGMSSYSDFSQAPATNRTLGFQKIFALSLPSRTDRQDSLELATAISDLEVDFADGVRGIDVDDVAFPNVCAVCYSTREILRT